MQAALKLVLEPIFEADFKPCSYGFRPRRRAQDAIAEIHYLASPPRNYEWVLEADIKACFDEIDHTALMGRVRHRIGDKRVLGLVKAFLKAGVLTEDGVERDTITGTPQGGILSPLLANIALSVLDEHFADGVASRWAALHAHATGAGARTRRTIGSSATRTTSWSWSPAPARTPKRLRDEVAAVLAPMGLRLSEEKTRVCHIDEGFDFLGLRIQRHRKRGTNEALRLHLPLEEGARLHQGQGADAHPTGRRTSRSPPCCTGSTRCCGAGPTTSVTACPSATFGYLDDFTWRRVVGWLRHKHRRANWK